jgi:hypothetical protein
MWRSKWNHHRLGSALRVINREKMPCPARWSNGTRWNDPWANAGSVEAFELQMHQALKPHVQGGDGHGAHPQRSWNRPKVRRVTLYEYFISLQNGSNCKCTIDARCTNASLFSEIEVKSRRFRNFRIFFQSELGDAF